MNRPLDELVSDLINVRAVTGLPPEIALQHLRDTLVEFYDKTRLGVQILMVDAQAGVEDYPIELHGNFRLIAIKAVNNGKCSCVHYTVRDGRLWVQAPTEDEEQAFEVHAIVKPSRDVCEIDETIYQDWADVIADGAAFRAFSMPKQPWTSTGLATLYAKKFSIGVVRAKNRKAFGQESKRLMMTGSRF